MAEGRERDFVLSPNEYLSVQDQTKGTIQVHVGSFTGTMPPTSQPIVYDPRTRRFTATPDVQKAIQQFPLADEGDYIVLDNPAADEKHFHPELATSNTFSARLEIGRKINIPGPKTFPLWPGQVARVVKGHQLRTNQYLVGCVYNDEAARANWSTAVVKPAAASTPDLNDANDKGKPALQQDPTAAAPPVVPPNLTMGKLLVIKGDEISFYIPPTGIEVVPDDKGDYVREAVTLERLEYCVLLSEDGNKRYVRGPDVVFPEPTETFIPSASGGRKYKAIELNDDMGLYIKVTADYEEGGKQFSAGDELFITGREQRLYYPRAEHSLIKYGDREIHYGVAIPEGEARYVLDKKTGRVDLVRGPKIFLPDPRNQVIVRRALTEDEVKLWYPGNQRALEHNALLREMLKRSGDTVTDNDVRMLSNVPSRHASRSVSAENAVAAFSGDQFDRGTNYTPPRTITLDTKFEGAVALNIWNGYAVLVVDKDGNQSVEVGPKTVLLEYDETLQVLHLSTGKPKNTDKLERTVYLRVSFNQVSDIVDVVTKDMVGAQIKLSYRVNFVGEPSKWFLVENYVKFMTDHARSLLRNAAKRHTIEQLNADYIDIVRDTILGVSSEGGRKGRQFEENGVLIYDVEVSHLTIGDAKIGNLLTDMQQAAVRQALEVASRERELAATKRTEAINRELADQKEETAQHLHKQGVEKLSRDLTMLSEKAKIQGAEEQAKDETNTRQMARERAVADQGHQVDQRAQQLRLQELSAEIESVVKKMGAISPDLIAALQSLSDKQLATEVAKSLSPLTWLGGNNLAEVVQNALKDTGLGNMVVPALAAVGTVSAASRALSSSGSSRPSAPGNGPVG